MEKAGLELHRLLGLYLEAQGDRESAGGYRARNAGSSHPFQPAQIYIPAL